MEHSGQVGRWRWGAGGLAGVAALALLAGCGSSTKTSTATTSSSVATTSAPAATTTEPTLPPTTTAPATTTTVPATTATTAPAATTTTVPATTTPTAPPTTSVIGLILSGIGNTFTAPASPTTMAYSTNCQTLIDPGFYGSCVIVTAPSGTIAAIVEQQQQNYQAGQPITTGQERDLVYRDVTNTWSLVLRRTPVAAGEAVTQVFGSDIMRDGDPKAVFVEPAANSEYGNELDIVEGSGVVTLYRQLQGGLATVPAAGGLQTYVPNAASGYDEASIAYAGGAWKITATSQLSQTQVQALTSQAFFDPQAIQATT